jgi:protein required for attachment to host cells
MEMRLDVKRPRTWILLADGGTARIVRQLRPNRETGDLLEDLTFTHEVAPLRELMSDRPGRSFASTGSRRSAMEYHSDPVRDGHQAFARRLAGELSAHRRSDDFDRLVLVAEPRMLGMLRDAFDTRVKAAIIDEIDKDLVKMPRERLVDVLWESVHRL